MQEQQNSANTIEQQFKTLKDVIQTDRLSFEARGLYFYLLSLEDQGLPTVKELSAKSPNASRDRIYRIEHELQRAGLLHKHRLNRLDDGTFEWERELN